MKRFLVVGGGGREAIITRRLAEDSAVCAISPHENPLILECAKKSGGALRIADPSDPDTVASFAREQRVDMAFVSSDAPLANGVVDALLEAGIGAVGATKDASRIEWDKPYAMRMLHDVRPDIVPFHKIVSDEAGLGAAVSEFESAGKKIVVKPHGLTGGKGVKVMPVHLPTYRDCSTYATELLGAGGEVLLVEKLEGPEFTIMGFTDGRRLELAPATYDYPYRLEGDRGPGTGGMGCITCPGALLPFMTGGDLEECRGVMQAVLDETRSRGHAFTGVINGGFFKTEHGIKFMEFNARLGDPEVLCVLNVMEGSLAGMLAGISGGSMPARAVTYGKKACVAKYLVSPEYPGSGAVSKFVMDGAAISKMGVDVIPASCVRRGPEYETLGSSRVAALVAASDEVEEASSQVNAAMSHVRGSLEYRRDIGSAAEMEKLRQTPKV